jgi:hypothetical protein
VEGDVADGDAEAGQQQAQNNSKRCEDGFLRVKARIWL